MVTGKVVQPPWGPSQGESWASSQGPSASGLVQRTQAGPDTCLGLSTLASPGLCRVQCCCLVSGFLDAGHLQVSVLLQGFPVTRRKTAAPGGGSRGLGSPPHEAWGVTVYRGSTQGTALALLAPSGTGPAGPVTLHQQDMSCLLEQRPPPPRVTVTPRGPLYSSLSHLVCSWGKPDSSNGERHVLRASTGHLACSPGH